MVNIITFILLVIIFYQDIKSRMIYWFLPVLIFTIPFCDVYIFNKSRLQLLFKITSINLLIAVFLFVFLYLYILYRYDRKGVKVRFLGLGDVMFILALTSWFNDQSFVLFLLWSFTFSLLISTIFILFNVWKSDKIPLAGLQSVFMIFYLITSSFPHFPFSNYLFNI